MSNRSNSHDEVIQVLAKAREEGVDAILNPSPAAYLENPVYRSVMHLILNETEAAVLSRRGSFGQKMSTSYAKTAEHFLRLGVQNVVITLGAKSAYYSTDHESGLLEAEQGVKVAGATEAG